MSLLRSEQSKFRLPLNQQIDSGLDHQAHQLLLEIDINADGCFQTNLDSQLYDATLLQLQQYIMVDSTVNEPFFMLKIDQMQTEQRSNVNHGEKFILYNGPNIQRVTAVAPGGPTGGNDFVYGESKNATKFRWTNGRQSTLTGSITGVSNSTDGIPSKVWLVFSYWKEDLGTGFRA